MSPLNIHELAESFAFEPRLRFRTLNRVIDFHLELEQERNLRFLSSASVQRDARPRRRLLAPLTDAFPSESSSRERNVPRGPEARRRFAGNETIAGEIWEERRGIENEISKESDCKFRLLGILLKRREAPSKRREGNGGVIKGRTMSPRN